MPVHLHLLSLFVLILIIIIIRSTIVNKAVINYFINELNIKQHFVCLKKFLFLEDGDFSITLSSKLFDKVILINYY